MTILWKQHGDIILKKQKLWLLFVSWIKHLYIHDDFANHNDFNALLFE